MRLAAHVTILPVRADIVQISHGDSPTGIDELRRKRPSRSRNAGPTPKEHKTTSGEFGVCFHETRGTRRVESTRHGSGHPFAADYDAVGWREGVSPWDARRTDSLKKRTEAGTRSPGGWCAVPVCPTITCRSTSSNMASRSPVITAVMILKIRVCTVCRSMI